MKLQEYKKLLKGQEHVISMAADSALASDWRIGAVGALNAALAIAGITDSNCSNENTADAVLHHCDRKSGRG
jgi:hypothetical protein